MKLGIDASNILTGGGIIHLKKILEQFEPKRHEIDRIIIWGGETTLENLPKKSGVDLFNISDLNNSILRRLFWQQTKLHQLAQKYCDLLFVPGGLYLGEFRPYVSMFQNMQIFESRETNREGFSKDWIRLRLLKWAQSMTFRKSSGLICLSEFSKNYMLQFHSNLIRYTTIKLIPHGTEDFLSDISEIRKNKKKEQKNLKILYVSSVKKYKHQWNLIDAVGELDREGFSVELNLLGERGNPQTNNLMFDAINRQKSDKKFIYYHGNLPYKETLEWYKNADIFAFPSTCETFGLSLLEAMTAGLAIASSDHSAMPEILKDSGLYFNPESVTSIKNCLRYMIEKPDLIKSLGKKAKKYSKAYSWEKCADETFSFIRKIFDENKK